jgi:hypothetical protein
MRNPRWGSTQRRRREVDFHSLKTEEKTVTASGVARGRDRIPNNLLLDGRQPTSAPTGVSRAGSFE